MEEKKKEVKQAEEKIPKTEEIKENKKEEAKEKGITEPIELTPRVKVYKDIMQQTDEIMSRIEEYRHTNSVKL